MGGHKALKATQLDSAEKENRPPLAKGVKRAYSKVSIGGLFKNDRNTRRKLDDHGSRDLRDGKDDTAADEGFFARFTSKKQKAEQHPVYQSFAEAAKKYEDGAATASGQELEPVYEELCARANGLDIDGNPVDTPGVPTAAQMDEVDSVRQALTRPLGKETIGVQMRQADGTYVRRQVKLDATMQAFVKRSEKKRAELEGLQQELDQVCDEIDALMESEMNDEDGSVKRADEELQAELAAIKQNVQTYKDRTLAELKQAQKEDKAASTEANRKIQEFMKALQ